MKMTESQKLRPLSLKDAAVAYAPSAAGTKGYVRVIESLAAALGGKAVPLADTTEYTVLVGPTAQTDALLADKTDAFAICVGENGVTLCGTDALTTLMAVQYCKKNFINKATLPATTVVEDIATLTLADASKCYATFVYGAQLYDKPYHPIPELVYTYRNWEMRDMPCMLVDETVKAVAAHTGLDTEKDFTIGKDDAPQHPLEIIIGISARPAAREALQAIDGGEYALWVRESAVVVTGWNYASLELSHTLLADLLAEANAAKAANGAIRLPVGFSFTDTANPAWIVDFPKPEGADIRLYNTLDTNDDSLQYLYKGVSAKDYRTYREALLKNGYAVVMENELEESLFCTLVNREQGVMLYIAYEHYAHEGEYAPDFTPALRIVSSPLSTVAEPPAALLTPAPYKKVTNTAVTNVEVTGRATGMGYIITLEDGSFLVFDGGGLNPEPREPDTLWNLLNVRYQQIYGELPTPERPIHVAAWIITHSHWDHYGAYRVFIDKYGKSELFQMDYMIGNFPSRSSVFGIVNQDILNMGSKEVMNRLHQGMRKDFTFLKVHAGQKFYFANLEMQVLMTYDNISPARIYNQNDTSTVLRFSVQATNETGEKVGKPYVMLWLGDANNNESRFLCAMYGKYLKSDSTSVAHHGNIGCESDLYNTVNATTVWWPHTARGARGYLQPEKRTKSWVYDVDQTLVFDNPHTRYIYFSGSYTRVDEKTLVPFGLHLTLPFGADGAPMHDDIFDTMRGPTYKVAYAPYETMCPVAMKIEKNFK